MPQTLTVIKGVREFNYWKSEFKKNQKSKMNLILKMQLGNPIHFATLCKSIRRFQMIFYSAHHFAKSTFFEDSWKIVMQNRVILEKNAISEKNYAQSFRKLNPQNYSTFVVYALIKRKS